MNEHKTSPPSDLTCACCWDDINEENYVEYQSSENSSWMPSLYCSTCIDHLLNTQWEIYVNALAKTTCKAEQRRLLQKGPPINISDKKALPCPDDGEVYMLWTLKDKQEKSPKLKDSLTGEERQKFWDEQSAFYIKDEPDDPTAKSTNPEVTDAK